MFEGPTQASWEGDAGLTEQRYLRLLGMMSETLSVLDENLRFKFTTGTLNNALGHSPEFWESRDALSLVHPDDLERILAAGAEVMAAPGTSVEHETRLLQADGRWAEVAGRAVNLIDDPLIGGIVLTSLNVGIRRCAERLNANQARALELIARHRPLDEVIAALVELVEQDSTGQRSSIWLLGATGVSQRAGWTDAAVEDWLTGQAWDGADLVSFDDLSAVAPPAAAAAYAAVGVTSAWLWPVWSTNRAELLGLLATHTIRAAQPSAHDLRAAEVAVTLTALAVEVGESQRRLTFLAHHDPLTGLANRSSLFDHLDQLLATDQPEHYLLLCDLNGFKEVNDTLGHRAGDHVLVTVAQRLRTVAAEASLIARLGGDEFVVIVDHQPRELIGALVHAIGEPIPVAEATEIRIGVAIGVVGSCGQASSATWLHAADLAMYGNKGPRRS